MEPPGRGVVGRDDAGNQHVDTVGLVKHAAAAGHGDRPRRSQQRVERLGRLRALVRAADLGDPDPRQERQSYVLCLDADTLLGPIRGVALERLLTDASVVVEPSLPSDALRIGPPRPLPSTVAV